MPTAPTTPLRKTILTQETPDTAMIVVEPLSHEIILSLVHLKDPDSNYPVFTRAKIVRDDKMGALITLSGEHLWAPQTDAISKATAPYFGWGLLNQLRGHTRGFSGALNIKGSARGSVTFPASHAHEILAKYRTTTVESGCSARVVPGGIIASPLITQAMKQLIEQQIDRLCPEGIPQRPGFIAASLHNPSEPPPRATLG